MVGSWEFVGYGLCRHSTVRLQNREETSKRAIRHFWEQRERKLESGGAKDNCASRRSMNIDCDLECRLTASSVGRKTAK